MLDPAAGGPLSGFLGSSVPVRRSERLLVHGGPGRGCVCVCVTRAVRRARSKRRATSAVAWMRWALSEGQDGLLAP